jgi:hypothetical protein
MTLIAEKKLEHLGETAGCSDHDHDLVHELSRRLDSLWRIDQYIANSEGHEEIQKFWRAVKQQEQNNIGQIKHLITEEIQQGCF